VLCPVAVGLHRGRIKAWSGFPELCRALRARGDTVVGCPGPGEAQAVAAALPGATLLPATDVGGFAALLAGSRLVVANDSGPGHLAAAVGARLVSIFGVTEPERTQPWGPQVLRVGGSDGWPAPQQVWTVVTRLLDLS
jgi:heptosyltransferase II